MHLVLPERPLFSRDKIEPSASIVLRVRGALEAQQVRAIRHLVASAVNGLKPQRVSIVDEAGQLLADGAASDVTGAHRRPGRGAPGRLRAAAEGPDRIDRLLGGRTRPRPRAALGRVRLQPHHRDAPTSSIPKAACCARARRARSRRASDNQEGQVTVGNELPGAQQPAGPAAAGRRAARPEQEVRGDRQLRDLPHDQDAR